jgi:hypothetical protein
MRLYTVQCRAGGPAGDPDVVLIKEGFCWPALFIPLLWALYHRLWWGVAAYIAVAAALGLAADLAHLAEPVQSVIMLGLALVVGWSANDWRRWTLERQGYRDCGVVAGRRLTAAEQRLFDVWAADPRSKPRELQPAPGLAGPDGFESGMVAS